MSNEEHLTITAPDVSSPIQAVWNPPSVEVHSAVAFILQRWNPERNAFDPLWSIPDCGCCAPWSVRFPVPEGGWPRGYYTITVVADTDGDGFTEMQASDFFKVGL